MLAQPTYGKQREPLLRVTARPARCRAARPSAALIAETGIADHHHHHDQRRTGSTTATLCADLHRHVRQSRAGHAGYTVTATGTNNFTVNAPEFLPALTRRTTAPSPSRSPATAWLPGNAAYLVFTTGGAANGLFLVTTISHFLTFTLSTPDAAVRSGNCLLPKIIAAGFTQSGTVVTVDCTGPHGLTANDPCSSISRPSRGGRAVSGGERFPTRRISRSTSPRPATRRRAASAFIR